MGNLALRIFVFCFIVFASGPVFACGTVVADQANPLAVHLTRTEKQIFSVAGPLQASYRAYQAGQISLAQFVSAILRWETETDFAGYGTIEPQALLENGALTPFAVEFLSAGERHGLSPAQQAEFARRLSRAPRSEHQALAVRLEGRPLSLGEINPRFTMLRSLVFAGPCRGFLLRDDSVFVVPSFTQLQILLDVRFGNQAIQLDPEIGTSPTERIVAQLEEGHRAFGLGYPGLEGPGLVDRVTTGWLGFSLHDYFHAAMGSEVPVPYRRLVLRGARLVESAGREKNWFGNIKLAPGHVFSYRSTARVLPVDYIQSMAIDMNPHSRMTAGVFPVPPNWGKHVLMDYGTMEEGWSPLIVRDAVKNPQWYRSIGIDPVELVDDMGAEAVRLRQALAPAEVIHQYRARHADVQ